MSISRHQTRTSVGRQAEDLAFRFLLKRDYHILARNWSRPWGEIDIVARSGRTISFVEVKGESGTADGFEAWRRANGAKLAKVARTARTWLAQNSYATDTPWQIDIIQVSIDHESEQAKITHFKRVPLK